MEPRPDLRDLVWEEAEFVRLSRDRVGLAARTRVADLGCGSGGLTRLLAAAVRPGGRVDGYDLDPESLRGARERARREAMSGVLRFAEGDALDLAGIAGGHYDAAACQKLLVHQSRPERVVAEMARVVRPSGRVLLIEPDRSHPPDESFPGETPDPAHATRRAAVLRAIADGARATGSGDYRVGSRLVPLMAAAGLVDVGAAPCPTRWVLEPPYGPAARVLADALAAEWSRDLAGDDSDNQRWLHAAGGGTDADWAAFRAVESPRLADRVRGAKAGTLAYRGGPGLICAWGIRA